MRALVTGGAGFVGVHLLEHLRSQGHEVTAVVLPQDENAQRRVGERVDGVTIRSADILDAAALRKLVAASRPEAIFHLAAFSNPEDSFRQVRLALETNILGAHNLLRAALDTARSMRVLLVGSAQQYGHIEEADQPIGEDRPLEPLTPYAVSKASQELLGQRYFLSEQLPVFYTRSFNHTGPGQADSYVCSSFARQVAEVELGSREPLLRVGNLSARRDFTDVRDIVRAYVAIVERGRPGRAYNVCRGEAVPIQAVLDRLIELGNVELEVEVDPERYHALDAPLVVGDNRRLRTDTDWEPRFSLIETLRGLLNDWRERLRSGGSAQE